MVNSLNSAYLMQNGRPIAEPVDLTGRLFRVTPEGLLRLDTDLDYILTRKLRPGVFTVEVFGGALVCPGYITVGAGKGALFTVRDVRAVMQPPRNG